jgi:hypothetical protein
MNTFITEIIKKNEKEYGFYEGPKISASNWEEAEKLAQKQGAILVGQLAD